MYESYTYMRTGCVVLDGDLRVYFHDSLHTFNNTQTDPPNVIPVHILLGVGVCEGGEGVNCRDHLGTHISMRADLACGMMDLSQP